MEDSASVQRRAARIKLLVMDCDGVLTDGRIWFSEIGEERKAFNVRDGLGLELWHRAGLQSGIISGRKSGAVDRRASELRIHHVRQGVNDKVSALTEILAAANVNEDAVAYIGDDLNDIPLLMKAELAIAVGDAPEEVRVCAHLITQAPGGKGAVREAIEFILKTQGRWSELAKHYL